ncbi:MAG TPA: N-acetylmuramic acid 6-phosphate etherase, partial [Anaeromyxobacter sp.]
MRHRPLPVTERVHPAASGLERLPTSRLLVRLHAGDLEAVRAVGRALVPLAALVDAAARALREGGRLVYAGAGTSGRLGALDAAECPPTFGVDPSRVHAIVAGGDLALRRSVEGAEDDRQAGAAAVRRARIGSRDLLVGISASGSTPFVLAALGEARRRGAATALVTSNPAARPAVDHRVVLETGPERVAGSTRMKAGTAAKMVLGLLSTGAFVRLGAVREGRMIALRPASEKLRRRAIRNVQALSGVSAAAARALLDRSGWDVRSAIDAALGGERSGSRSESGSGSRSGSRSRSGSESRSESRSGSGSRSRSGTGTGTGTGTGRVNSGRRLRGNRRVLQVRRRAAADAEAIRDRHLRGDDERDELGERHPDELRPGPDVLAVH